MAEPQIGDIKDFGNGKRGRYDGHGWEDITNQAAPPSNPAAPPQPERGMGEAAVESFGLPTLGGIIGGKTPLGPVGSAIGTAAGQGYGDLMKLLGDQVYNRPNPDGIPTMGEEAGKLATTAGLTYAGEKIIPPVLRGIGAIKGMLPKGSGLVGGGGLGWLFGHPQIGASAGLAMDMAPSVANGVEWLGTPAGQQVGQKAAQKVEQAAANTVNSTISKQTGKAAFGAIPPSKFGSVYDDAYREAGSRGMSTEGARKYAAQVAERGFTAGPKSGSSALSQAFQDVPPYLKELYNNGISGAVRHPIDTAENVFRGLFRMGEEEAPVAAIPKPKAPALQLRSPTESLADVVQRTGTSVGNPNRMPETIAEQTLGENFKPGEDAWRNNLTQESPFDAKTTDLSERHGLWGRPQASAGGINPMTRRNLSGMVVDSVNGSPVGGAAPIKALQSVGPTIENAAAETDRHASQTVEGAEGLTVDQQNAWEAHKAKTGLTDNVLNLWLANQPQPKTIEDFVHGITSKLMK